MTMGQYLLIDTIALIQGDIVGTTAEAAELCSQQPRAAPVPETWNPKMKPLLHHQFVVVGEYKSTRNRHVTFYEL